MLYTYHTLQGGNKRLKNRKAVEAEGSGEKPEEEATEEVQVFVSTSFHDMLLLAVVS
jgi:hypothetical protein